ncbi:MAG TPA: hypothetical protein DCE23_01960 [Firmicutes bacterium]|nr:hypothetical protein [Bacillota bacterium]
MGFFKDVWSTITGTVSDVTTIVHNMDLTGKKTSNIADKARQGILQFPCICSNSIDMATASLICKAVEKRYAVFVQETYSLYSVATVDGKGGAIADYIRTQHHNINNSASMADVINVVRGSFENLKITDFEEPVFLESIIIDESTNRIIYENRIALEDGLKGINMSILNDMCKPILDLNQNNGYLYEDVTVSQKFVDDSNNIVNRNTLSKMTDSDSRKANEMAPTTLAIKVHVQDKGGAIRETIDIIIGVKAVLHPVSTNEVINNLSGERGKFFDFIRWTSGEISFFKDFLFAIDDIKRDVVNKSRGGSGWFSVLKRTQARSNILKRFKGKGYMPNATLIVTLDELQYLKSKTGMDLTQEDAVKNLMNRYFLLGFIIVDSATESIQILDGRDGATFETLSFNSLKRESTSNAGAEFKEILKSMNKY